MLALFLTQTDTHTHKHANTHTRQTVFNSHKPFGWDGVWWEHAEMGCEIMSYQTHAQTHMHAHLKSSLPPHIDTLQSGPNELIQRTKWAEKRVLQGGRGTKEHNRIQTFIFEVMFTISSLSLTFGNGPSWVKKVKWSEYTTEITWKTCFILSVYFPFCLL